MKIRFRPYGTRFLNRCYFYKDFCSLRGRHYESKKCQSFDDDQKYPFGKPNKIIQTNHPKPYAATPLRTQTLSRRDNILVENYWIVRHLSRRDKIFGESKRNVTFKSSLREEGFYSVPFLQKFFPYGADIIIPL